ncbi:hypothetical protein OLB45_06985, partial [Streptococcus pneumoniae]|nr:hypothetical protein [Streptococcus pneumoniae]
MNIKYISVENSIAEWADKKGILKRWDGLNQYTLNRWIKEMRENRTFSMYVINPTHKLVFINLEGPNFKLKLATQKKFTWRLVVQAFFRV